MYIHSDSHNQMSGSGCEWQFMSGGSVGNDMRCTKRKSTPMLTSQNTKMQCCWTPTLPLRNVVSMRIACQFPCVPGLEFGYFFLLPCVWTRVYILQRHW